MRSVEHWTGAQVQLLRHARRMSVRQFARHLGVSDQMISKWESGGSNIRPYLVNQAALDQSLRQCTPVERNRFDGALQGMPEDSRRPRRPIRWSPIVDLSPGDVELAATIAAAVKTAVLGHDEAREVGLHR